MITISHNIGVGEVTNITLFYFKKIIDSAETGDPCTYCKR